MKIFQFIESLSAGDGMGNHTILTQQALRQAGYQIETFANSIASNVPPRTARYFSPELPIGPEDIILLQFGVSGRIAEHMKRFACRKIMMYHNITPPHFFAGYDSAAYRYTSDAYQIVAEWARLDMFDAVIAPSHYNINELHAMGFSPKKTAYLPGCLIPVEDYNEAPDQDTLNDFKDGRTNILFVGRITPNKKQQDIVRAYAYYQACIDPTARLIFVGSGENSPYGKAIKDYIRQLGLKNVIFPGFISSSSLVALYQSADVFVCMSEHEGFCIPLVEAMIFDVPIIAFDAAAVPDTLGGAGVLLHEKDPALTAKWIERIVKDADLRARIIAGQRRRLEDFNQERTGRAMADIMESFISEHFSKYQYEDERGIHEKDVGSRIDGALYDIVSENLLKTGKRPPISKERYLKEMRTDIRD